MERCQGQRGQRSCKAVELWNAEQPVEHPNNTSSAIMGKDLNLSSVKPSKAGDVCYCSEAPLTDVLFLKASLVT